MNKEHNWPDGTAKSRNNGFTHGYGDSPHGWVSGMLVAPSKPPARQRKGAPITIKKRWCA